MTKKDHRINEHGVSLDDLKPGQWITMRWKDAGDIRCLLLEIEKRPKSYKGERDIKVFEGPNGNNAWHIETLGVHTQVVAIHGWLNGKALKISKYE